MHIPYHGMSSVKGVIELEQYLFEARGSPKKTHSECTDAIYDALLDAQGGGEVAQMEYRFWY